MSDKSAINTALAKFQAEIGPIPKNRTANIPMKNGGKYSYKYADLADVIEVGRKILADHGLSVSQGGRCVNEKWQYVTTVHHSSGEEFEYAAPMRQPSEDPKSDGAWFTYYRRYGWTAALGLSSDEDTDSEGSMGGKDKKEKAPPPSSKPPVPKPSGSPAVVVKPPPPKPVTPPAQDPQDLVTEAQVKNLFAVAKKHGWSNEHIKVVLNTGGIQATKELTKADYEGMVEMIKQTNFDTWFAKFGEMGPA